MKKLKIGLMSSFLFIGQNLIGMDISQRADIATGIAAGMVITRNIDDSQKEYYVRRQGMSNLQADEKMLFDRLFIATTLCFCPALMTPGLIAVGMSSANIYFGGTPWFFIDRKNNCR